MTRESESPTLKPADQVAAEVYGLTPCPGPSGNGCGEEALIDANHRPLCGTCTRVAKGRNGADR